MIACPLCRHIHPARRCPEWQCRCTYQLPQEATTMDSIPITYYLRAEMPDSADDLLARGPEHRGEIRREDGVRAVVVDADGRALAPADIESVLADPEMEFAVRGELPQPPDWPRFLLRARDHEHASRIAAEHAIPGALVLRHPSAAALDLLRAAYGAGYPVADTWPGGLRTPVIELRDEAELRSTAEVAAELGIDETRVRRLATSRGLGRRVGRSWAFTTTEVDAMRHRVTGRPRKVRAR